MLAERVSFLIKRWNRQWIGRSLKERRQLHCLLCHEMPYPGRARATWRKIWKKGDLQSISTNPRRQLMLPLGFRGNHEKYSLVLNFVNTVFEELIVFVVENSYIGCLFEYSQRLEKAKLQNITSVSDS